MTEPVATLTEKEQGLAQALNGIRDKVEIVAQMRASVPDEAITENRLMEVKYFQIAGIFFKASLQFWAIIRKHHEELPDQELTTDGLNIYMAEDTES